MVSSSLQWLNQCTGAPRASTVTDGFTNGDTQTTPTRPSAREYLGDTQVAHANLQLGVSHTRILSGHLLTSYYMAYRLGGAFGTKPEL